MTTKTLKFDVAPEVLALGLRGSYLLIEDLKNRESDAQFESIKEKTIEELVAGLTIEAINDDQALLGFRRLHDRVGRSNTKNIASPEALLQFMVQRKTLPQINLLVDIYNLISVKTHLALGAHDMAQINGDVHLRITNGTERFIPLGYQNEKKVGAGEYGYTDDSNDIICRMETRQVEKTKVTLETKGCFYIVQGNMNTDHELISKAVDELIKMTSRFCGGTATILYSSPDNRGYDHAKFE